MVAALWLATDARLAEYEWVHTACVFLRTARADGALVVRGSVSRAGSLQLQELAAACGAQLLFKVAVADAYAGGSGLHFGGAALAALQRVPASAALRFRSCACHSDLDAARAIEAGFDAVLASPIYAVPGKGPARGVRFLSELAARFASEPRAPALVALGGVSAARVAECRAAGAVAVCVMRAVWNAPDSERAVAELLEALAKNA